MKNLITTTFLSSFILLTITACSTTKKYSSPAEWVAESKIGPRLPLATKAGEWSEPKQFQVPGGVIEVKSEFVKHHGSTCIFNVSFTNVGTSPVDVTGALTSPEKLNIYHHNSARLKLDVGVNKIFDELEARECTVRFGTTTDMDGCAACQPWAQFANKYHK